MTAWHRFVSTDSNGVDCLVCGVVADAEDIVVVTDPPYTYTVLDLVPWCPREVTDKPAHHWTPTAGGIICARCRVVIDHNTENPSTICTGGTNE